MLKKLYDIESFPNFFCVGIEDFITGKQTYFEISEVQNDIELIIEWFGTYKDFLISFNGIHYDNVMIKYILNNANEMRNQSWQQICSDLKYFSDKLILDIDDQTIKNLRYSKSTWIDIDLYAYWSKMLRLSQKISLKGLGIQMGYPVVQELPFQPDTILKREDLPKLREYNLVHDLGILKMLTNEMEGDIKLRAFVFKNYKIDAWSLDAPKIAGEVLLKDYCQKTRQNPYTISKQRFERPTIHIKDCLKGFNPNFQLPLFQKLWEEVNSSVDSFSKNLHVNIGNTNIMLTYGVGGLHSVNSDEIYHSCDKFQIKTSDIASLYPTLIINYKCIRYPIVLNRYAEVKNERLVAKKNKDKMKDTFLKLILNSISGLLDMSHSWLYFPQGAMRLRIIGQLFLTKAIEVCIMNNWQVISANTDGIEVIVPKDECERYEQVLCKVAEDFNLIFEHEDYKSISYKNVNNYIAVTESGAVKRKGLFLLDYNEGGKRENPLGKSCNEFIVAKALNAYFTEGVTPREYITNHEKYPKNIYDFCRSDKVDKQYTVLHNGEPQQRLNRYYFSKNGPYLYKLKKGKTKPDNMNVGKGVFLLNTYVNKPIEEFKIDYDTYIASAQKIIDEMQRFNQLTLF